MRPSSTNAVPRPGPVTQAGAAAVLLLALAGCTHPLVSGWDLPRQAAINGCINRCQAVKDQCDADARHDYQQCQAGYTSAQRTLRWCHSAGAPFCGYPWWSCSENRYGYCTNRYWECRGACERTRG